MTSDALAAVLGKIKDNPELKQMWDCYTSVRKMYQHLLVLESAKRLKRQDALEFAEIKHNYQEMGYFPIESIKALAELYKRNGGL